MGKCITKSRQRLKKESPYAKTMMATLTNGMANSGYIPDDASFGHNTFEVLSVRVFSPDALKPRLSMESLA